MPTYTVKDSTTGKTVTFNWNSDAPPTDADMEEVFAATRKGPSQEPPPMVPIEGASPYEVGGMPTRKELEPVGRPMVETAFQMGGEAIGGGLGGAPGLLAGGTAGYTAGSYAGDLMFGDSGRSLPRRIGEGAVITAIPFGIGQGIKHFGKGAVRSAIKIPPTQISKKAADQVVDTIVDENLRVGPGGVKKAKGIINAVEKRLDALLSKSGSEIDTVKFVQAIDDIRPQFKYSSDPAAANSVLDDIANKAMNHPLVANGKIPIAEAHKLKKGLYQELKSYYGNLQSLSGKSAVATGTESVGTAAWAESLRKEVLADPTIPKEAVDWLKREGNVIQALRWIQRRSNVAANMDPITFNDVLIGGMLKEGIPYAVAVRFARSPKYMSQLGIWMARGGEGTGRTIRTGASLLYPRPESK